MSKIELDYMEYSTDEICRAAYVSSDTGIDAHTKALLHMNGPDASTTFTDEIGKLWTAHGDAQLDTAAKKFGTASGLFDGDDWVDTPDHADFDIGNGEFTVDFWLKRASIGTVQRIAGQCNIGGADSSISIECRFLANNTFKTSIYHAAGSVAAISTGTITDTDTWHHIAIVRDGDTLRLFIDGSADGTGDATGITANNSATKFSIGRLGEYEGTGFDGHIDEFRFSKGIARWTENFVPPTAEYAVILQCYSEDTIIQQGTYSLKIVAAQTGSLNDTLTKSGLSIDLSNKEEIKLNVRADRTGTNLQARLYDSVGGWITKDINITSADEFQEFTWDISGISNANKSNITKIEFKILNADSTTIYYIDNMYAQDVALGNSIFFGMNF